MAGNRRVVGRALLLLSTYALLSACALFKTPEPGIGKPVAWDQVAGWQNDRQEQAWPALLNSCAVLAKKPQWSPICAAASQLDNPDTQTARAFFETWFSPHPVFGAGGERLGLITGYYEPLLLGSFTRDERYRYPLYGRPDSLLTIDLGDRFPELKNKRLRGRVDGQKVVPYYSRAEIERDRSLLAGSEILWLDDRDALFFLHIQGSGRVELPDGSMIGVGYADQNGHPYRAIGKVLVDQGELTLEEVTLFSIRRWLQQHPEQAEAVLNQNPSYVFFVLRDDPGSGPVGSLNTPLTPERSIAIDPSVITLGLPMWLSSYYPGRPDQPFDKLVFAQDTGGAIKGNLRADLFWGFGETAEKAAGEMKSEGSLMVLLPKSEGND